MLNNPIPLFGIAITTQNRTKVLNNTIEQFRKYTPDNIPIFIVDDASTVPVKNATFRFNSIKGIAAAKNKCLEILMDTDIRHFFLVDDDTYPTADGWWEAYIYGELPHAMSIFQNCSQPHKLYDDDNYIYYNNPRGCFLYYDRVAIETVGGMDTIFGRWGHEHVELSWRIHHAGLTPFPFPCPKVDNIYCLDQDNKVPRTTTLSQRNAALAKNDKILKERIEGRFKSFVPYRERYDVVITSLFGADPDPQRKYNYMKMEDIQKLVMSVKKNSNMKVVLITDMAKDINSAFSYGVDAVVISKKKTNIFFQRHIEALKYLQQHDEIMNIWCVDATDVQLINSYNNFNMSHGVLYTGCEPKTLDDVWMINKHPDLTYQSFFASYKHEDMLNAGVFGGDREIMIDFLREIVFEYSRLINNGMLNRTIGDMGTFNYVARTYFNDKIKYGNSITTLFKHEKYNNFSLWKHK